MSVLLSPFFYSKNSSHDPRENCWLFVVMFVYDAFSHDEPTDSQPASQPFERKRCLCLFLLYCYVGPSFSLILLVTMPTRASISICRRGVYFCLRITRIKQQCNIGLRFSATTIHPSAAFGIFLHLTEISHAAFSLKSWASFSSPFSEDRNRWVCASAAVIIISWFFEWKYTQFRC